MFDQDINENTVQEQKEKNLQDESNAPGSVSGTDDKISYLDIVIPYVNVTVVWKELIHALRGIEKYADFDYRIFIVGDKLPDFLDSEKVLLIKSEQVKGMPFAKCFDQWRKIMAVINDDRVSENFIYAYDDQVWMKKTKPEFFDNVYGSPVVKSIADLNRTVPTAGANWRTVFMNTVELLKSNKRNTRNYEIHVPRLFSKSKLLALVEKYGITDRSHLLLSTLYYNEYETDNVKDVNDIRLVIKEKLSAQEIGKRFADRKKFFIDYNNEGLTPDLKKAIQTRFPSKSAYEV